MNKSQVDQSLRNQQPRAVSPKTLQKEKEKKHLKSDTKTVEVVSENTKSKVSSKYKDSAKKAINQESFVKTKFEVSNIGSCLRSSRKRPRRLSESPKKEFAALKREEHCEHHRARVLTPMTLRLHTILKNVYGNIAFKSGSSTGLHQIEAEKLVKILPQSRQEYNFFKQRLQILELITSKNKKSQQIINDRLMKENKILQHRAQKFDLFIQENFSKVVRRRFSGFDSTIRGIERPIQILRRIRNKNNPHSLHKFKLKGTLSLSPQRINHHYNEPLMMVYETDELGNDVRPCRDEANELLRYRNQDLFEFRNSHRQNQTQAYLILPDAYEPTQNSQEEWQHCNLITPRQLEQPSDQIFSLQNYNIDSKKYLNRSISQQFGIPYMIYTDQDEFLKIKKVNLMKKPSHKSNEFKLRHNDKQIASNFHMFQILNQSGSNNPETNNSWFNYQDILNNSNQNQVIPLQNQEQSGKNFNEASDMVDLETRAKLQSYGAPQDGQVGQNCTPPIKINQQTQQTMEQLSNVYYQIKEQSSNERNDELQNVKTISQIQDQQQYSSKLKDAQSQQLNPVYRQEAKQTPQTSKEMLSQKSPNNQTIINMADKSNQKQEEQYTTQIVYPGVSSIGDQTFQNNIMDQTALIQNNTQHQENRTNSGYKTMVRGYKGKTIVTKNQTMNPSKVNSTKCLNRNYQSDQLEKQILLTASFKDDENMDDNMVQTQKTTFLTQVDHRNQNMDSQVLRYNSKSHQRAHSREKERSTVFGQTERVESKIISYEDKSPQAYELTPQYLQTRSMLSSEKKSQMMEQSKVSLPKQGQIKNITIDRIVKDPQLINGSNIINECSEFVDQMPDFKAFSNLDRKQEQDVDKNKSQKQSILKKVVEKKVPNVFKAGKETKTLKGVPKCLQGNPDSLKQLDQRELKKQLNKYRESNKKLTRDSVQNPITLAQLNQKPPYKLEPTHKFRDVVNLLPIDSIQNSEQLSNASTILGKDRTSKESFQLQNNLNYVSKKPRGVRINKQKQLEESMKSINKTQSLRTLNQSLQLQQQQSQDPRYQILNQLKIEMQEQATSGNLLQVEDQLFKDMNIFDENKTINRFSIRKSILKNEEASRRLETSANSVGGVTEIVNCYNIHENNLLKQDNELFADYKRKSYGGSRRINRRSTFRNSLNQQSSLNTWFSGTSTSQLKAKISNTGMSNPQLGLIDPNKTFFQVKSFVNTTKNKAASKILFSNLNSETNSKEGMSSRVNSQINGSQNKKQSNVIVDPEVQNRRYQLIMELHRQVRLNNKDEQSKVTKELIPKLNFDQKDQSQGNANVVASNLTQFLDMPPKVTMSQRTYQIASDNHLDEKKNHLALSNFNNKDLNFTNDLQKSQRNFDQFEIQDKQTLIDSARSKRTLISGKSAALNIDKDIKDKLSQITNGAVNTQNMESMISSPKPTRKGALATFQNQPIQNPLSTNVNQFQKQQSNSPCQSDEILQLQMSQKVASRIYNCDSNTSTHNILETVIKNPAVTIYNDKNNNQEGKIDNINYNNFSVEDDNKQMIINISEHQIELVNPVKVASVDSQVSVKSKDQLSNQNNYAIRVSEGPQETHGSQKQSGVSQTRSSIYNRMFKPSKDKNSTQNNKIKLQTSSKEAREPLAYREPMEIDALWNINSRANMAHFDNPPQIQLVSSGPLLDLNNSPVNVMNSPLDLPSATLFQHRRLQNRFSVKDLSAFNVKSEGGPGVD